MYRKMVTLSDRVLFFHGNCKEKDLKNGIELATLKTKGDDTASFKAIGLALDKRARKYAKIIKNGFGTQRITKRGE